MSEKGLIIHTYIDKNSLHMRKKTKQKTNVPGRQVTLVRPLICVCGS